MGALTPEPLAVEFCFGILDCQWHSVQTVKLHYSIFQSTLGRILIFNNF